MEIDLEGDGGEDLVPVQPEALVGKMLLVGITRVDSANQELGREQVYGEVLRISEAEGLVIRCAVTGDERWLPPDPEFYEPAAPGHYRLRNGHEVTDPDYLATFTVRVPSRH